MDNTSAGERKDPRTGQKVVQLSKTNVAPPVVEKDLSLEEKLLGLLQSLSNIRSTAKSAAMLSSSPKLTLVSSRDPSALALESAMF